MGFRWDQETKRKAVEKIKKGENVKDVAKEVGCSEWSIKKWVKKINEAQTELEKKGQFIKMNRSGLCSEIKDAQYTLKEENMRLSNVLNVLGKIDQEIDDLTRLLSLSKGVRDEIEEIYYRAGKEAWRLTLRYYYQKNEVAVAFGVDAWPNRKEEDLVDKCMSEYRNDNFMD